LEWVTIIYQIDGLGITLWSPAAGLSLALLLICGPGFAPFVFIAALIADYLIYSGPRGAVAPVGTSFVLALGLCAMAEALRPAITYPIRVSGVTHILLAVTAGTLMMAAAYCLFLLIANLLSPPRLFIAIRNFWIGDTLGIISVLPATAAIAAVRARGRSVLNGASFMSVVYFAGMLGPALWMIFGLRRADEFQFFYLLFLPVIWVAVLYGYTVISLALLPIHVLLVAVATSLHYPADHFIVFQMLMLVLSGTGLLLGSAITEASVAEHLLLSQQADLARAARQALVGATGTAIAHEISQPLASATSYLHAARRMLRGPSDPIPIEEALVNAEAEARRARETLERIRDYVSTGRLNLSRLDVKPLAQRITNSVGREAAARGVCLKFSVSDDLPKLQADRIQIEQLLFNLLSNAIDAAAESSEPGLVQVRVLRSGDRIRISVDDNGPGIAGEIQQRLFQPFETTKRTGMGLGLTLVRQIVDAHEGEIRWNRRAPHGVRFDVELPINASNRHDL